MKHTLLGLALLAGLPFAASAQDSGLNYNYVEGGYIATKLDRDTGDTDADGAAINGSVALNPNFHLFAGYSRQSVDTMRFVAGPTVDADIDQWRVGVGYNLDIGGTTDLVARLAYERSKLDQTLDFGGGVRDSGSDSDDGYSAEVGVRHGFTDNFEGTLSAGHQDFGNNTDDFYGRLGAHVMFSPNWGVSADVKFVSGETQWFVGPRYSF